MHGWDMMYWGWGGVLLFGTFWIILIGLVIWIVYSLGRKKQDPSPKTPQDILKERYARGEIDRSEYMEKMQDLR